MQDIPDIPEWYINEIKKQLGSLDFAKLKREFEEQSKLAERFKSQYGMIGELLKKYISENDFSKELATANNIYKSILDEVKIDPSYYFETTRKMNYLKLKESDYILSANTVLGTSAIIKGLNGDISANECFEFLNYLAKHPMLGYKNSIGKKIYASLKQHEVLESKNIRLFRVKKPYSINRPYVEEEMYKGPYLKTDVGRFSNTGINYVYFSEELEIAKSEAGIDEQKPYTFMEVELIEKMKIFDITDIGVPLFNACHKEGDKKQDKMEINYLIPNYIANCANEMKYDGIKYLSTKNLRSYNYVFFDVSRKNFTIKNIAGVNFE